MRVPLTALYTLLGVITAGYRPLAGAALLPSGERAAARLRMVVRPTTEGRYWRR